MSTAITFEFKMRAISVNQLYVNIKGQARRFKSAAGKQFCEEVKQQVTSVLNNNNDIREELKKAEQKPLSVEIVIGREDWHTKGGNIRRLDIANQEKVITDSIMSALEANGIDVDDSQFFELVMRKEESDIPFIRYTIIVYTQQQ
jgi:Holliday junction resolvase RusA-like endonuclease